MVISEIRSDRAQARQLFAPPEFDERPPRYYPPPMTDQQWSPPSQESATRTEAQHREVAELELRRLQTSLVNGMVKLKRITDEELDRATARLEREIHERDELLRGHLRYVLAGSVRRRAFGAGLLITGVLAATTGSVLGTLA